MLIVNIVIFFLSLAILVASADILVKISVAAAVRFRLSPLIVGSTIVAFGTSLPELAVTVSSIFQGSGQISLGNLIGSNIANIGLILAIALVFNSLRIGTTKTQKNNIFFWG